MTEHPQPRRVPVWWRALAAAAGVFGCLTGGLACSMPSDAPQPPVEDGTFPHPQGYGQANHHGQDALDRDGKGAQCAACHDRESAELTTIPGCRGCHAVYPHETSWESDHGPQWLQLAAVSPESPTGRPDDCRSCHGSVLDGGQVAIPCNTCHAAWPHGEGWEEATVHGAWLATRGGTADACHNCHQDQLTTTELEGPVPTCGSCHAAYPHMPDWSDPRNHGEAWRSGDCGTCHGASGDGGALAPACRSCHPAFPHGEGWSTQHPASVDAGGSNPCLPCHNVGDGPAAMISPCGAGCHGEGSP